MAAEIKQQHTWLSEKLLRDVFNEVFRWHYRCVSFHLLQRPGMTAETKQQHTWLSKKVCGIFSVKCLGGIIDIC